MHSITTFVSVLCLATSALARAQYGDYGSSGSDSSYGSSTDTSNTENESGSSDVTPDAAAASSAPAPATSSATPAGQVPVHVIKVSNKNTDLIFEPNNLQADVGHLVQFQFWPKAHSVVRSTFDQPCVPINSVNSSVPDLFSGFLPVAADATSRPTFTIVINDTKPIWYYCSQGKHCQAGMVGVINPPAQNKSRTIESFTELAKKAPENVSPSVEPPAGGASGANPSGANPSGANPSGANPSGANPTGANPTGTTGDNASSTNDGPTATFTGAANAFADRQGTVASVAMAVVLGLFATCL